MEYITNNIVAISILITNLSLVTLYLVSIRLAKTDWLRPGRRFIYLLEDKNTPERGDGARRFFGKASRIATVAAAAVWPALFFLTNPVGAENLIVSAITIFAWIGIFSTITDLKIMHIPSNGFKYSYLSGIVIAILALTAFKETTTPLDLTVIMLSWGIIILALGIPAIFGAGGMSDVRIVISATMLFWWWLPVQWVVFAFLMSAVTGILFWVVTKIKPAPVGAKKPEKTSFLSRALKPPHIKMIEDALDAEKATDEQVAEWLKWRSERHGANVIAYGPHLAFAMLTMAVIGFVVG